MILACLSHIVAVFCAGNITYIHNLETGVQFKKTTPYQTLITTVDIEKSQMLYPDNQNLTKEQGFCGCRDGKPFLNHAEDE